MKVAITSGVAISGSGVIYGSMIEPNNIEVTINKIPMKNLPSAFEGYKIAQITDLHMGSWLNRERLDEVVNMINAHRPDMVTITGDFITMGDIEPYATDLVESLSKLQATDGVFGVLGNHDHWSNVEITRKVLQEANIIELPNEHKVIEREGSQLIIAGLDDVWENQNDIEKLVSGMPPNIPAVLMAHEPDIADEISQTGLFGLQISGHSHGGQIRLPFIGAPLLPRLGRKYPDGSYQVKDMIQYTNRGIGMVDVPIRINCPREIALFTLHAA